MKKWVQYSRLIWHMGCFSFWRILILMGILLLIGAGFLFAYFQLEEQEEQEEQVTVAFSLPEESTELRKVIGVAKMVPSVSGFCQMEMLDEEEALSRMREGTVQLAVAIPDLFYNRAQAMEKAEFKVYAPKRMSSREEKFVAILHCFEGEIATTEAAMMSIYPEIDEGRIALTRRDMENAILRAYTRALLLRTNDIRTQQISPFGKIDGIQYYIVDILIFWILLAGSLYLEMYTRETDSFEVVASAGGGVRFLFPLIRMLVMAVQLFLLLAGLAFAGDRVCSNYHSNWLVLRLDAYGALFLTAVSMAAFIHLAACIGKTPLQQKIMYYVIVFLLALVSGGLLPVYFLPDLLQKAVVGIPFYQWHQMVIRALWSHDWGTGLLPFSLTGILFILAGTFAYQKRMRAQ